MPILTEVMKSSILALSMSKVISVPESVDRSDCSNCRPMSLLIIWSKIIKIIHKRIYSYLNSFISTSLIFVGSITLLMLLLLFDEKIRFANHKKESFTVFLDLKKAFDNIDHKILSRFAKYGLGGPCLKWMASYLSIQQQCVKKIGVRSKSKWVSCVAHEGSI